MAYGICSQCKKNFHTEYDFDSHPCAVAAMKMSREELEAALIKSGKLSSKEKR